MKANFLKSNVTGYVVFITVFFTLFSLYGLNKTFFQPPQSIHTWRQTNCTSLAQTYFQYDLPFFEPEMLNQFGDGGNSGKAVGEFPIIYYSVAKLWKLFGKHDWIFKLVQITIFFVGLISLFHGLKKLFKNQFLAGFASLLVFTSPMVVFYGPNFMPDVPALSFVFIAWLFVIRFLDNRKNVNLWISALFFCLAMLLKITSAISFIALGGWIIFELIFLEKKERVFQFKWNHFVPFLVVIIPVVFWYKYADYYNTINRGHFSHHGIWPIWQMTKEQFNRIVDVLDKIYFKEYFLPFTQYITFVIWLYLIITIKKLKPVFRYFIIVLPIGFLIELMLWFQVLDGHDYYLINLIVVFVAVWVVFLMQISKLKSKLKYFVYGVLGVFFIWNTYTCQKQTQLRYVGWMNELYNVNYSALTSIEPSFEKWGIDKGDKVISIPDYTINATLYYMNRKGYTEFGSDFSKAETFFQRIEQGAKYLVVNDSTILSREYLKPFIQKKVGEFENVIVFDIQNIKFEN